MKRSFGLSVTLCDALVLVLMLFKSSQVSVQAVQRYREIHLTARNGSISSPNYPKIYPKNIEWTWIIRPSHYTVILEIKEMDLYRCYLVDPAYEECTRYDHVTIAGHGIYCNGIKPDKVISFFPWTEISITFKSLCAREQCRGNGFKAHYRLVMETTAAIPKTLVPTYLTDKHKTVDDNKEILEVSIPIVFGIVVVAIFLIVLIIWCYRKKSSNRNRQSPRTQNSRATETRNRLLGLEIEQQRDQAERPPQDEPIRYSNTIRNDVSNAGVPLNYGPPPSYDDIGRNDSLNRSHNLEFPPSYETAMNESTAAHSAGRLQVGSGVDVTGTSVPGSSDNAQRDSSSRPLNQARQTNISNEASSSERSEVFV